MPIAEKSPDSEQELRWRAWQEKGRRADRLAERRMKVLFSIVGLILVAVILYYGFRAKIWPDSDHVQHAVRSDHISILIVYCRKVTITSC
jgi:type VI protein secretion system component VasF